MIMSIVKTYALQACAILLGVSALFSGLQTWRLSSAHDKIDEQRQLIVDVKAANLVQQASIDALRKANADWAKACKADAIKWSESLRNMTLKYVEAQRKLKNAPKEREVIYRESKDECAKIPVPAGIIERLRN